MLNMKKTSFYCVVLKNFNLRKVLTDYICQTCTKKTEHILQQNIFTGKCEVSEGTSGHMNKVLVPLSQNATRLENKVLSILRLFQICVSALFSRFQKLFSFLSEISGTRMFCQKSSWTNLKTIVIQTFLVILKST